MRTEFLDKLSEALTLGRLDPSIVITIGDDGIPTVDVSEVVRNEYERHKTAMVELESKEAEPNPTLLQKVIRDEKYLYDDLLDGFIGEEYINHHGVNIAEYEASVEKYEGVKSEVLKLEKEYEEMMNAINFKHVLISDVHDLELIRMLEKEKKHYQIKAADIMDKIITLKFG